MVRIVVCSLLLVATLFAWHGMTAEAPRNSLPRFTEEREAAALHFVKKHLPDMLATLEQLKKDSGEQYQKAIREIFQVTEILADLRDDMPRHDLELKIWITENKAHLLAAKLSTPSDDERKKIQDQLQELARQLVTLDIEHLEMKIEQLERELGDTREELTKIRENRDKHIKDRFDALLQQAAKKRK